MQKKKKKIATLITFPVPRPKFHPQIATIMQTFLMNSTTKSLHAHSTSFFVSRSLFLGHTLLHLSITFR